MYHKKIPKSELPDKNLYTIHEIIEHRQIVRNWNQGWLRVVSIDPGEKNLAIRIECRSIDATNIHMEVFEKYNLHDYINSTDNPNISSIYGICIRLLDQYINLFKQAHFIIIERQMVNNYKMIRLSQCIITYFLLNLKDAIYAPLIYEIDNKLKTKQLNAPKNMTEKQVKKWAIEVCLFILEKRKDLESINLINKSQIKKKDDLSDTVIQIEALFKYLGYKTTFDTLNIKSESYFNVSIEKQLPDHINLNNLTFPQQFNVDNLCLDNLQYPPIPGLKY